MTSNKKDPTLKGGSTHQSSDGRQSSRNYPVEGRLTIGTSNGLGHHNCVSYLRNPENRDTTYTLSALFVRPFRIRVVREVSSNFCFGNEKSRILVQDTTSSFFISSDKQTGWGGNISEGEEGVVYEGKERRVVRYVLSHGCPSRESLED